jgi:hypothetical protein
LDPLVLTDMSVKDCPLCCISRSFFYKPKAVANAFRSDQDAFGIQAVKHITEPLTFFTDQIFD